MRNKTLLIRCLALALCAALLCPALPASAGHGLDALTIGIVAAPDMALLPLSIRERDPLSILALCYEGLVKLNDAEQPEPCLAESWDAPEGTSSSRWTFHLRKDVTFHNGQPLTAHDVAATLDYIFQLGGYYLEDEKWKSDLPAEERGVWGNLNAYISSWKAMDDHTLQVSASRRYYGLLNAMTFPVLPANMVNSPCPPGTGPYKIEEYEMGERIWLTSNTTWWKAPPTVYNIIAYIFDNEEDSLDAFDSGIVDTAMTRSLAATRYSGSMRSFSLSYRTRQLEVLFMQHVGLLAEEYLRRAIISAIDRSVLVKNVYQDMATPVTTPIAPGTWLFDESATQESYNPAAARAILEQNGWVLNPDGKRVKTIDGTPTELKLRILTYEEPGSSVRRNAASNIIDMLAQVGISCSGGGVTMLSYDDAKLRLEKGNFDLALAGINLDVVPDAGFMLMQSYAMNYCRYQSEPMTKNFTELRKQTSENGYYTAMREIQQQFVMDAPFMCLYFRSGALLTRQTFTDVRDIRELELFRGIEEW